MTAEAMQWLAAGCFLAAALCLGTLAFVAAVPLVFAGGMLLWAARLERDTEQVRSAVRSRLRADRDFRHAFRSEAQLERSRNLRSAARELVNVHRRMLEAHGVATARGLRRAARAPGDLESARKLTDCLCVRVCPACHRKRWAPQAAPARCGVCRWEAT